MKYLIIGNAAVWLLSMMDTTGTVLNYLAPALAPYLHTTRFTGEGSMEPDGLHIRFYEV